MIHLATLLAQIDPKKIDADVPKLVDNVSSTSTWIMVLVIAVGILLIAFKQARRNFRD